MVSEMSIWMSVLAAQINHLLICVSYLSLPNTLLARLAHGRHGDVSGLKFNFTDALIRQQGSTYSRVLKSWLGTVISLPSPVRGMTNQPRIKLNWAWVSRWWTGEVITGLSTVCLSQHQTASQDAPRCVRLVWRQECKSAVIVPSWLEERESTAEDIPVTGQDRPGSQ